LLEFIAAVVKEFAVYYFRWYSSAILWGDGGWCLMGSVWWLCIAWCSSPGKLFCII